MPAAGRERPPTRPPRWYCVGGQGPAAAKWSQNAPPTPQNKVILEPSQPCSRGSCRTIHRASMLNSRIAPITAGSRT